MFDQNNIYYDCFIIGTKFFIFMYNCREMLKLYNFSFFLPKFFFYQNLDILWEFFFGSGMRTERPVKLLGSNGFL